MDPQKLNFSFGDFMSIIKVEIVRQVINSAIRNGIDIKTIAEDYQQVRNTLSFSDAQKELKGKMLSTDEKSLHSQVLLKILLFAESYLSARSTNTENCQMGYSFTEIGI